MSYLLMNNLYTYRNIKLRKPFEPLHLPLLVRAYQKSFKSGRAERPGPMTKVWNRLLFYSLINSPFIRWQGTFCIRGWADEKPIVFNARNRQFNSLYFYKYQKVYESETSTLIDLFLPDEGVFYDIGCNWGYFSLFAAVRNRFRGMVHSFEPWKPTFDDLESVVSQAGFRDIITCHNLALSSVSGECGMTVYSHSGLNKLDTQSQGTTVKTAALDDLSLSRPDFLKVDVEGHESEMFTGAKSTLAASQPFIVFEHTLRSPIQGSMLRVFSILQEYGYRFFVPAWRVQDHAEHLLILEETDTHCENRFEEFVLFPLDPEGRALYPERLNIFACHVDKLELLKQPKMGYCFV